MPGQRMIAGNGLYATPNSRPRYNAAPTQSILAVRYNRPETGERMLDALR
jgi:putative SOS response-associated peptidase YedK